MSESPRARIGLLADIHWTPGNADRIRDLLGAAADRFETAGVDRVVVLGDLVVEAGTRSGTRERLAAVRECYDLFDVPVHDLPGNHDLVATTRSEFAGADVEGSLADTVALGDDVVGVLLDTAAPGRDVPGGELGADQRAFLDAALADAGYAVVFSHHPLYAHDQTGGWFEDEPAAAFCRDADRATDCFGTHGNVLAAVNGHTHRRDASVVGGVPRFTINAFTSESPDDTSVNGSFAVLEVSQDCVRRISYRHGSFDGERTVRIGE